VPQARPEPPKAAAKPAAPTETASTKESDFNADEVAALLNKQDAQGGGAKRTTETASLGGERTTRGNTLSQSEMDALRGQIQKNWNIIPGMADGGEVRVTVRMRLDMAGNIVGEPDVTATGGSDGVRRTLSGSARRAVLKSQPYQLPQEKYDSWAEVIVNFDPSQMF
ncbi:cell envelope integrity protein TolA, partial [Hoeflea sp. BAL378]|uniref:cell envelope integrity protein TolA n=1 Tax=Hoeflea sp. BAL378 TaxID=1547437 RepID=UPI001FCA9611